MAILVAYYALCVVLLAVYRFFEPPITAVQLQRRIESLVERRPYRERKTVVSYGRIPQDVTRAVVAAEDGRFWSHWGFDIHEMRAASVGPSVRNVVICWRKSSGWI